MMTDEQFQRLQEKIASGDIIVEIQYPTLLPVKRKGEPTTYCNLLDVCTEEQRDIIRGKSQGELIEGLLE
jgi:hypothetical protein